MLVFLYVISAGLQCISMLPALSSRKVVASVVFCKFLIWIYKKKKKKKRLKFPKKTVFRIFCRAEQIFSSKVGESQSKIDIDQIVEECINDHETKKDFFEGIEEDCTETISPILRACVTLYIKIRSHSHAKNIAEKYRKKTQTLKKKKGIRSELKARDKE